MDRTKAFIHSGVTSHRGEGLPATQITIPRPPTVGLMLVSGGFADSSWGVVVEDMVKCTGLGVRISQPASWYYHLLSMISDKFLNQFKTHSS